MNQIKTLSGIFTYIMIFAFMVSGTYAAQQAVDLGTAGNFVILAKSGISTTGTTSIVGDIGVSPIDSTALTGFGLILDSTNQFATSPIITGKAYAADYEVPTPSVLTTAVSDMQTAFTDAAGRTLPDYTELGAGNIDGMTLAPGLYKWGTGVIIPNGVTISGGANDIWIFQIAQDLTIGSGAIVTLSGGAQAKNIYWQVAGETTLGTTSDVKGIILSQTSISMNTGAKLSGRALAQTAVTLDANAVTAPTGSSTPNPAPNNPPTQNTQSPNPVPSPTQSPNPGEADETDWECTEWSICNSAGIQTKKCTQPGSTVTSTEKQSCTLTKTNLTTQTTTKNTTALITTTTPPSTEKSGFNPSGWAIALVLLAVGVVVGGYFYLKK